MMYITLTRATSLSFTSLCILTTQTYSLPVVIYSQVNIVLYQRGNL